MRIRIGVCTLAMASLRWRNKPCLSVQLPRLKTSLTSWARMISSRSGP